MRVEWPVKRRGTPSIFCFDNGNGTNFVGTEKELLDCIKKWNTNDFTAELAYKDIKCKFNPPNAPHQGGIWEELDRGFNKVPYKILGTRHLTDEL